jgi:hypothetical protein
VNLKMLYKAFCYNLDHLMTLKIKEILLGIGELYLNSKNDEPDKE